MSAHNDQVTVALDILLSRKQLEFIMLATYRGRSRQQVLRQLVNRAIIEMEKEDHGLQPSRQ